MIFRRLSILVMALYVIAGSMVAQELKINKAKLPKPVLDAFQAAYPSAVIKGASKEKEDGKWSYEIESLDGKTKRDIQYAPDGTVLETEETVDLSSIPGDPKAAIAKLYPKGTITSAEKSTTSAGTQYEIHVKNGHKSAEVKFDAEGKLVTPTMHEKHAVKKGEKKEESEEHEHGKDKDDDDDSPVR